MSPRLLVLCAFALLLAAALFAFPPQRDEVGAATRQPGPAAPMTKTAGSATGPSAAVPATSSAATARGPASLLAHRDNSDPGNLFATPASPRPRAAPPKPAAAAPAPPPAPPPALPYRYLGRYAEKGEQIVFVLAKERAVPIHPGDVLDGMFRVESIDDEQIVFVHEPTDQKLSLSTTEGAR